MADDLLRMDEAAEYVGVNRVKFSRLVKRLRAPYKRSPHDDRIKWFRRGDLEEIRQAPRVERTATE